MSKHEQAPQERLAQTRLAQEVTTLVHGSRETRFAETVTEYITGKQKLSGKDTAAVDEIGKQLPTTTAASGGSIVDALVASGLAASKTDARRLMADHAVYINNERVMHEAFTAGDFNDGVLLLRRGKAFKDSALVKLG